MLITLLQEEKLSSLNGLIILDQLLSKCFDCQKCRYFLCSFFHCTVFLAAINCKNYKSCIFLNSKLLMSNKQLKYSGKKNTGKTCTLGSVELLNF